MRTLAIVLPVLVLASAADARPRHKTPPKRRVAHHVVIRGPIHGQSVGAPWDGALRDAARLAEGEAYHVRRSSRAFGTRSTVELIERVVNDARDQFPDQHTLAIGDLSAEHGGPISEHRSHQSGRDADIGLFYQQQPDGY